MASCVRLVTVPPEGCDSGELENKEGSAESWRLRTDHATANETEPALRSVARSGTDEAHGRRVQAIRYATAATKLRKARPGNLKRAVCCVADDLAIRRCRILWAGSTRRVPTGSHGLSVDKRSRSS